MAIRAGRLRHTVTIERNEPTRDATGAEVAAWSRHVVRRASIEPLQGREFWASRQTNAEVSVRVRLRWDGDTAAITPKDRVVFDGRTFDVVSVIVPNEARREVHLMCTEAVT